ncbi:MAG: MdtA/MuxA family multidrug efflux RND transporter periplasmic adaptor subunit [Planctomycetaceae bacterium]|nr:MdtA/MuxA family multidrug efflux RND transporter periplasmic adaptor subunit [Planctomycetaceae bacterium]
MISKPIVRAPDVVSERSRPTGELPDAKRPEVPGAADEVAASNLRASRWWWLLLVVLAAGAWYFRADWLPWLPIGTSGGAPDAKPAVRVIPVKTATVEQRDLHQYLNGLGTVTALKTVTLKSRVDGELIQVRFAEGQMVGEGELLMEIDPRMYEAQLHQVEGQLTRDEATLKLAKLTLARVEDLLKQNSIAPQQVDDQVAQVQQIEGTIETDQALVANARLQLSYCRITAPINGRIGLRLVDQGNMVRANDLGGLAVITQLQPIALVFTIPQDDIPRVLKQTRENRELTVDAYDRDFKTKLATGKLSAIDNQVDSTTGTLRLKAVFDNEDGLLFPNQFVNARLLVDIRRNALVVPTAAVQRGPNGVFVYAVKPDETVDLRYIAIGPSEGAMTAIESGLEPGELVVTDGVDKLVKDSKVSLLEAEPVSADAESNRGAAKEAANQGAP